MVMRIQTGSGAAAHANGAIKGAGGGQSPNTQEITRHIRSEDQMMRIVALGQLSGCTRALAYLAATAEHQDVREGAMKQLLRDRNGLFRLLEGLTGRCPEPWERVFVRALEEALTGSTEDKILALKTWQLGNSKSFSQSGRCMGMGGQEVEFTDESPAVFEPDRLAGLIEQPGHE